jgi:solute carrier family 35 protein F5
VHLQEFEWPKSNTLLFLLLNGFLGSMVSDVLWALAVVLTSPFAASLGLALTIPLGWIGDFIFHSSGVIIAHSSFVALLCLGFSLCFLNLCLCCFSHQLGYNYQTDDGVRI